MAEEKCVHWDEIKRKIWFKQTWEKTKLKVTDSVDWVKEHPIAAASLASSAGYIISKIAKIYGIHAENVRRDRDFYDPHTGRHTKSYRNLDDWESEEVDRRFKNGETYSEILRDMKLTKRRR